MEKLYTDEQYAQNAVQASADGEKLYKVREMQEIVDQESGETVFIPVSESLDVKPAGYYICSESNITDGTLNPNYEQEQQEKEKQARIKEIHAELDALDLKSVRPLRAGETDRLATLEAQAVELREELQELINAGSTD